MVFAPKSYFGFQSTLPRRERLYVWQRTMDAYTISIHAPAKGATQYGGSPSACDSHFNPRSREGSDEYSLRFSAVSSLISIHAPAKGATLRVTHATHSQRIFQPTLPRRERPRCVLCISGRVWHFNPRSREGSDIPPRHRERRFHISIHAPAKGATPSPTSITYTKTISIHAPAKGATISQLVSKVEELISIHAPAKGATSIAFALAIWDSISIHAPAKGATDHIEPHNGDWEFQSTLPRRERR